eukprot:952027-Amphidinium_carterae.1
MPPLRDNSNKERRTGRYKKRKLDSRIPCDHACRRSCHAWVREPSGVYPWSTHVQLTGSGVGGAGARAIEANGATVVSTDRRVAEVVNTTKR